MPQSDLIFIEGEAVEVGSHGDTAYTYSEGDPVPNTGKSTVVFESGVGLGGGVIVDSFEDGDTSEYVNFQAGGGGVVSSGPVSPIDGSLMLEVETSDNANGTGIISTSGLPVYPEPGDTFGCYTALTTDARSQVFFGSQDTSNPGYFLRLSERPDEQVSGDPGLRLGVDEEDNYLDRDDFFPDTDVWYDLRVTWQTDGTITGEALRNGSVVASVSATDTTYTDGGIGFRTDSQNANVPSYYDFYRLL